MTDYVIEIMLLIVQNITEQRIYAVLYYMTDYVMENVLLQNTTKQ